jgi:cobyrinic acid a,c-diamide synthase
MVGIEQSRALLYAAAQEADLILIEGAMGLFDGSPSSADLAEALGIPVAAVIDANAMAQTFGAVAHGLRSYRAIPFAGVIANRVAGPTHAQMLVESLPAGLPMIAALPHVDKTLPERHLGLIADTDRDPLPSIDALADAIGRLGMTTLPPSARFSPAVLPRFEPHLAGWTIAVARDDAFCFLYPANLRCLVGMGARLVFFSPVADDAVPESDALYLPGGYPELHAARLAGNERWRASVRAYAASKHPVVAECGGLMAIVDTMITLDRARHAMAGLLPGTVTMRGSVTAIGLQALRFPEGEVRGHTFHHSAMKTPMEPVLYAEPHGYGQGEAVYRAGQITASYVHAYFPSNAAAIARLFGSAPQRSGSLPS